MGRIAIADTSDAFVSTLEEALADDDGMQIGRLDAIDVESVDAHDPQVLVMGPSVPVDEAVALAITLSSRERRPVLVLVSTNVTTDLMRRAMWAGFADVMGAGDDVSEIAGAVRRAHDRAARSSEEAGGSDGGGRTRVVTVFSTKGGVGKSVLSTNLAAALATHSDMKTVLVDLDLQFGDVGIMLGMEPTQTISDVVAVIDRLDADLLAGYLAEHSSGLQVLLAPRQPEEAETITAGRIAKILGLLAEMFDVIVIDTAATFDEVVLTALDKSTDVFPVTMMDVASIKNTRISLQKLEQLGYGDGPMKLVLNRADSKVLLQDSEVENAVGAEIFTRVPSDRLVPRSVNKGTPVVLEDPRSRVSKVMVELAESVAASAAEVSNDVA